MTKRILVMPDSFKGTMSSETVCRVMKEVLQEKGAQVKAIPVADGGEGTIDCFLHAFEGTKRMAYVNGPFGEPIEGYYGAFDGFAVVESAVAAGFRTDGRRDPSVASTYGVGQLIRCAIEDGYENIILGMGGSCTNDGGAGMAAALGTVFKDADGISFIPTGSTLDKIAEIDKTPLGDVKITAMCDVDNVLHGPRGAAYVFAPQKGADEKMVEMLDAGLKAYAEAIKDNLGIDVSETRGAGAAGGLGAAASVFLDAELKAGIDVILDLISFEELVKDYDYVITGEGCLDQQSLSGKVAIGIARRAGNTPVIAVVGDCKGDRNEYHKEGISEIWVVKPEGGYGPEPDYEGQLRNTILRNI